jgi:hypothetical protein
VNGEEAERTPLGKALLEAGFQSTSRGLLKRSLQREPRAQPGSVEPVPDDAGDEDD